MKLATPDGFQLLKLVFVGCSASYAMHRLFVFYSAIDDTWNCKLQSFVDGRSMLVATLDTSSSLRRGSVVVAKERLIDVLQAALNERRRRDPRYSLRAFARDLGVGVSTLSEVINGVRPASMRLARQSLTALAIDSITTAEILADLRRKRQLKAQETPRRRVAFSSLDEAKFQLIAAWHHFAILGLIETVDFVENPAWIGERLDIAPDKASESLALLAELGLIKRNARGRLVRAKASVKTSDGVPSAAVRESHRQLLALAQQSLERDPVEIRDFFSMSMTVDPRRLAEAREMARKYAERICRYLSGGDSLEVYRYSVSLFPVTRPRAYAPRRNLQEKSRAGKQAR